MPSSEPGGRHKAGSGMAQQTIFIVIQVSTSDDIYSMPLTLFPKYQTDPFNTEVTPFYIPGPMLLIICPLVPRESWLARCT